MQTECFLGVDTSNYTTSLGLVTRDGEVLANLKAPLAVSEGGRGLRQSEALFAHTKNLPSLTTELGEILQEKKILAIGVSSRPRNVVGSYMPCFLAGVASAHTAASVLHVPLYEFSHQCGHLMAAIHSANRYDLLDGEPFGAFHVSGGTTELVRVIPVHGGFETELVGGTKDVNAGQIIDRIGVEMGLSFPCGLGLEKLALQNTKKVPNRKPSINGCYVNLSGLENMAIGLYKETNDKPLVAAFVLEYIGNAILQMALSYIEKCSGHTLLFAGGVMCNSLIKNKLSVLPDAVFAAPPLSADNAVGTACLAHRMYRA